MSTSWSIVGPLAAFANLLEVRVPGTHSLHGLSCSFAENDGDDVEEDEHRGLVQAVHRQHASACLVVGHRLGAKMDDGVSRARDLAGGLGGDGDDTRAC